MANYSDTAKVIALSQTPGQPTMNAQGIITGQTTNVLVTLQTSGGQLVIQVDAADAQTMYPYGATFTLGLTPIPSSSSS